MAAPGTKPRAPPPASGSACPSLGAARCSSPSWSDPCPPSQGSCPPPSTSSRFDELRVLIEEELAECALREAMEEDWDSDALPQPEEQRLDGGMPANRTPRNEALTLSSSAERQSSIFPVEDMSVISHEPQGSNGKPRGKMGKTRGGKGKNGAITLDSSVERERHGSPFDMAIVPYELQGSRGNGTSASNPSAENGVSESPVDGMSIVPHDPEGTNGQIKCRKGKKRGRHFDREVRAKILQGSYLNKAKKMAEIKAKQDEDKLAARLHSFRTKLRNLRSTGLWSIQK